MSTSVAGKTVFITGGSRGIGLAVAIALAKQGANIAIAAKTAEPHPKLPGTIFTAAAEIEKAGGKALALVQEAIHKTVQTFGGIDILINNASAIDLSPMQETSIKKFDLMNQINTRGTWIVCKLALPYLMESAKKRRNPHILMMAPPPMMETVWFAPHVAYTMAKYGMSMCVLGLSGELADQGIAVNALWPMHGIDTSAVSRVITDGSSAVMNTTRKVDIMADASLVILQQDSKAFTGRFCIDETVLRHQGVECFDGYKTDMRCKDDELMPDFFMPPPQDIFTKYPSRQGMKQVLDKTYIHQLNHIKSRL